jgi:hypothetical protein
MNSPDHKCWETPATVSNDAAKRLIRFLNQWATHSRLAPGHVTKAFTQIFPALESLRKISFVDLSANHREGAAKVFETVAGSGQNYESTGASKILHTWAPETFVMWDGAIAAGYGIHKRNGHDYAQRFLPRVQEEAREAIETYISDAGSSRDAAISAITAAAGHGTLAKLLDEYNYVKFTLSADELWRGKN